MSWGPIIGKIVVSGGKGSFATQSNAATNLYVTDADGFIPTKLVENADSPTWSPDGKYIAFFRWQVDATGGIYAIRADGTGKEVQILEEHDNATLAWSPDNTYIAYETDYGGTGCIVYRVQGKTRTQLYKAAFESTCDGLSWSPDSKLLIFGVYQTSSKTEGIFSVSANGTVLQQITPFTDDDRDPAWKP